MKNKIIANECGSNNSEYGIRRIRTAVLGATGLVGQQFVRMLADHPWFDLSVLCSSPRTAGRNYLDAAVWSAGDTAPWVLKDFPLSQLSLEYLKEKNVELVFSALPASVALERELESARNGFFVFSNARSHRMDQDVPILIPEVNPGHLEAVCRQKEKGKGFIVTNSNCSTAGLVMTLAPLLPLGIRSVRVSTYQAVSGAGISGLAAVEILGNAIPFISGEEEKMKRESMKILGTWEDGFHAAGMDFFASCCRVPVLDGHLENVWIELDQKADARRIELILSGFSGIPQKLSLPTAPLSPLLVYREPNRPQPRLDAYAGSPAKARGMAVSVGRVRVDKHTLQFSLLVHNTIRGAAGTCILNAELAAVKGLIPGFRIEEKYQ